MNPILKRAFIDTWALKLARAALESKERTQAIREEIRERYGAETLAVVDAEWPFVMLSLIDAREGKSRR